MKASDFCSTGKYYPIVEKTTKHYFTTKKTQIEYTLANCDMLCFILADIKGLPYPANSMPNANKLHTVVANGWKAIPYTKGMTLLPNDIIEWSCNHVAYYIGNDKVYASWWTNYNGTSGRPNRWDNFLTNTIAETVDYFYKNYQYRFFHETTLADEQKRGGGNANPSYVLRYQTELPKKVEKNENVNQLHVDKISLNVRISYSTTSSILGAIGEGYYDVSDTKVQSDYTWYQLGKYWVAGVKETQYYPKKLVIVDELEDRLNRINDLVEGIQKDLDKIKGIVNEGN